MPLDQYRETPISMVMCPRSRDLRGCNYPAPFELIIVDGVLDAGGEVAPKRAALVSIKC